MERVAQTWATHSGISQPGQRSRGKSQIREKIRATCKNLIVPGK